MHRILMLLLLAAGVSAEAAPAPAPPAPAWSPTVSGVHGRLVATATKDAAGKPQIALALEIENTSDSAAPIAIPWTDDLGAMLRLTLEDAAGKPLPDSAPGGNYMSGPPYTLLLPVASTLRKTISPGIYEYVSPDHTMVRPLTFQGWDLPANHGALFLRATMTPATDKAHPNPRAWSGPLVLPRVALP